MNFMTELSFWDKRFSYSQNAYIIELLECFGQKSMALNQSFCLY